MAAATVRLQAPNLKMATHSPDQRIFNASKSSNGSFIVPSELAVEHSASERVLEPLDSKDELPDSDPVDTDDEVMVEEKVLSFHQRPFIMRSVDIRRLGYMEGVLRCVSSEPVLTAFHYSLVRGKAMYFAMHKVGSQVLQTMLLKLPQFWLYDLLMEFVGHVNELACQSYGSRVLVVMVHSQAKGQFSNPATQMLVDAILSSFDDLVECRHGHKVLEALMQTGDEDFSELVTDLFLGHRRGPAAACSNRHACALASCIVRHGHRNDACLLARHIMNQDARLLLRTGFGIRLLELMMNMPSVKKDLLQALRAARDGAWWRGATRRGLNMARRYDLL